MSSYDEQEQSLFKTGSSVTLHVAQDKFVAFKKETHTKNI